MPSSKIIIYQTIPRLIGNNNLTRKENGTIKENGSGKMSFFNASTLKRIKSLGVTHIWYTGVIRHALKTDYSSYGIPRQHPSVIKGNAGSPYAIADYYDIDPDIADNVDNRMEEFELLVERTHKAGLKVIIDFVPNHVAREYRSIKKPKSRPDLGQNDNPQMGFSSENNFYYSVNTPFEPSFSLIDEKGEKYNEFPARATGNDHFDAHPGINDWYETIKLNYGIDYLDYGGKSYHFDPIPSTWHRMTEILMFWASKGIDGFRCDMAEMVPAEFWAWAIDKVKFLNPKILFIGEVYNPSLYRTYISSGFDFLYDKVGMYDCLCSIMRNMGSASEITSKWQEVDDILPHMLYFLENHDEVRLASDFLSSDAYKGLACLIVSALMGRNPFMLYFGQEVGERGMDKEGFSGLDGRTTIFDYWTVLGVNHEYFQRKELSLKEKDLEKKYSLILNLAKKEKAIYKGEFFDLMYANFNQPKFSSFHQYAFIRKSLDEVLLIVVNFSDRGVNCSINIPKHAFEYLNLLEGDFIFIDLLSNESFNLTLKADNCVDIDIPAYYGRVLKLKSSSK